MLQHKYINVKGQGGTDRRGETGYRSGLGCWFRPRLGALAFLGFMASIGLSLVEASPTHAAGCSDGSISCIAVQFGSPVGDLVVDPSSHVYSATQFYLPVSIDIGHAPGYSVDYSIKVYGSGSSLTDISNTNNTIPSVLQNTSFNDLGKDGSQWGMRWHFGDTIEDVYADYRPVPASSSETSAVVVSDGGIDKAISSITKQLPLGFAVAVDSNQASGSYSNTITVAVVASPKDARTLFDISTMQEMTSDICERTTTPAATAISTGVDINATATGASYTTAIDTTGSRQGNTAYVPQKELTDTRDGKKYTIRKLADGNCWMVSNLEFDLVPTSSKNISAGTTPSSAFSTNGEDKVTGSQIILTNKDTDLNSMREWTPAIAAETYGEAGTVWLTQRNAGKGDGTSDTASATTETIWATNDVDGLRSFSSTAAYPNALYSTKTTAAPHFGTANTGDPWQRFGDLYNWTAATLGSNTKVTVVEQDATDSICPRGWKLPSNTGSDSFATLLGAYELPIVNTDDTTKANQIANFPLNFMRTGLYRANEGKVNYREWHAFWWSATRGNSASAAYLLATNIGYVRPHAVDSRGLGIAIRCVAR